MKFKERDFLKITDYTKDEIEHIFKVADDLESIYRNKWNTKLAEGKILATLFFQPSTRTQFSFQTAMLRLGGDVIGFSGTAYTSFAKGETLEDAMRMMDKYANIVVMRHPDPGSAEVAAKVAEIPVINGGDGSNRHPTQALLDLYTIKKFKGKIKGVKVTLYGDLRYARVAHSMTLGLAMFGADIVYTYPGDLSMPEEFLKEMREKYGVSKPLSVDPETALKESDVIYHVGPIQDVMIGQKAVLSEEERQKTDQEFIKNFGINRDRLERLGVKDDLLIMHALPRRYVDLDTSVDTTKHCGYFEEAGYGIPVRMALIALLLGLIE